MRLWRLTKPQHAPGLDGEGARFWGGRWNSPGRPMVYCATSPALAALETFVHLSPAQRIIGKLPTLRLLEFVVPDDVVTRPDLPPTMAFDQRFIGDIFLQHNQSVGMIVPSLVIPQDQNVLLNPRHPDFARCVKLSADHAFEYDQRLATLS